MIKEIRIGYGSCGIAAGADEVYKFFEEKIKENKLNTALTKTGCIGLCYCEVIMDLITDDYKTYTYQNINLDRADKVFKSHVMEGAPVAELLMDCTQKIPDNNESRFMAKQKRIVLRNCGKIDPESIENYIEVGGYKAIEKVLNQFTPEKVIDKVTRSGLRGRGGGGFPTGKKWSFAQTVKSDKKYVICNADEGDPGAFMDRSVLESDPHSVIEGMMIAAFAIGSDEGYIYARAEYPLAVERLKIAIAQAKEKGFLGKNILGTDFSFEIKLKEGAGAFVCGEETALIGSVEGKRGMPNIRPPFPAVSGLNGKPTIINNVETLANLPWIITNGAESFAKMGTVNSKGTKIFALAGKIKRGGLAEVPMGITINEIVYSIAGGSSTEKKVKAVQIGGPSGGCLPSTMFDTKIDYEEVTKTGAIMGSGGLVVMDEESCMVDIAKFFLNFTQNESCGKCTFCRVGTKRMLETLTKITEGKGTMQDLELMEDLAGKISRTSLCGLGKTAPNPVISTLKYFRDEYMAHILNKKCPARHCKALLTFTVDASSCKGCTACLRACPNGAITGELKHPHKINQENCIKCGICFDVCKFDAVIKN
ncbi:MAG: NADH-quinone oxidoreductase subunit NuoF [Armatimonadota bacterium]